ncbi:GNAT family N-acetyltransferase [Streptomyces sennicomposti]|uniref:GNAT family N-acetyltransferase n=1 Tax=Streptomyces sennicomposti TaxID=2873384 RepID=UPI001CA6E1A7|nr:GNAT family N-acetyltransferase [Streptomyces sennicomposti]MBY8864446.1 GNAT family N-acetyltransferase [Streptomyces sennicomposti]
MLTLTEIAENPLRLARRLKAHDGPELVFRPLTRADTGHLAGFLGALSSASRRFSTFDGYDRAAAQELCDAIARYDKLRLVLEEVPSSRIVGLLELSLALTPADIARYRDAGIRLAETTDCRFGPTLADDYQGRGVGTLVCPLVAEVVRLLGRTRIILWGGVRADNPRAIRYYEKNGFRPVDSFTEADGSPSLDMMLDLSPLPDPSGP